ncbi:MAG: nuclear transport factor 2 family protein [bacterium]
MKTILAYIFVAFLILVNGCQPQQEQKPAFTDTEKETIQKEVKDQFNQLVGALNKIDSAAWSELYSKEEFVSAIVGTDYYGERGEWVDLITNYFSTRETQKVEPIEVRVTALSPELALMTSEEKTEMVLKSGENIKSKHVFTMLWKKGKDGWKILHSHESWMNEKVQ